MGQSKMVYKPVNRSQCNNKRIFVTQPSNAAVWANSNFQKKRLPHMKIGYAADGERHYSDQDQIVYCTIGHLKKRLLYLIKKTHTNTIQLDFKSTRELENHSTQALPIIKQKISFCEEIMIDEVHNGNADNRVVMQLLKKYFDIKVILVTATLSSDLLDEYGLKDKYAEHMKTDEENKSLEVCITSDDKQSCIYSVKEERNFPLEITFNDNYCDSVDKEVYNSVAKVIIDHHLVNTPGHYLIFAPGQAEIISLINDLYNYEELQDCLILPAYGDLGDELKKIFEPTQKVENAMGNYVDQRKIIVSTNIMESSITIDGVGLIVNIPLERIVEASSTQRSILICKSISKASMTQREGRAGRTMPGKVVHMCTKAFYDQLLDNREEEIKRIPIYNIILELLDANIHPQYLLELDENRYQTAIETLRKLKMINDQGTVTDVGHFCPDFPLSIYASSVLFNSLKEKHDIYAVVCLMALIECNGPSYFYKPKKKRGGRLTDEDRLIADMHNEFKGKSDLHTMLNIYNKMMAKCRGLFNQEYKYTEWSRKYSMNNKKLQEVRQLIKRILSIFDQLSIKYTIIPIETNLTILNIRSILSDVYSENIITRHHEGYLDKNSKIYKISNR
jgi:HrpA-like RNA helicase